MKTPVDLFDLPSKDRLVHEFNGKPLSSLRTPAFIIDRAVFANNCALMHSVAQQWGARFRAHLKTHKTAEGAKLQLVSTAGRSDAVVVSTMMEAWQVLKSGLVGDGIVRDILYGLPVAINKISDLSDLWEKIALHGATLRLIVDHPDQIDALNSFESQKTNPRKWSVFVKIDCGDKRAGITTASPEFESFLKNTFASPYVSVYGFYCHGGSSYGSTSLDQASSFLTREVEAVNTAAAIALNLLSGSPNKALYAAPFILSVGSTPTAHAASATNRKRVEQLLNGVLELHAGNYPLLDLQQLHTSLIRPERIAQRVLATVISYYPGRGAGGQDEACCDAGAIALSKDTGPSGGFGYVIGKNWQLGRISQEHGILTRKETELSKTGNLHPEPDETLKVGEQIQIVGQHACLIAAAYPWYYIVDSGISGNDNTVIDIWVPWKGW